MKKMSTILNRQESASEMNTQISRHPSEDDIIKWAVTNSREDVGTEESLNPDGGYESVSPTWRPV